MTRVRIRRVAAAAIASALVATAIVLPAPGITVNCFDAAQPARASVSAPPVSVPSSFEDWKPDAKESDGFVYRPQSDGTVRLVKCSGALKSGNIVIPSEIDGKRVSTIASEFAYDCGLNYTFVLPEGLERIEGGAFGNCRIDNLPSTLREIGDAAFVSCLFSKGVSSLPRCLEKVGDYALWDSSLPGGALSVPASLKKIGACGLSCHGLKHLKVDKGNGAYKVSGGVLVTRDCKTLVSCPLGDKGTLKVPKGVKEVPDYFFMKCQAKKIILPKTLKRIGYRAFRSSHRLKRADVPGSVKEVGNSAFRYCTVLEPHVTAGVKKIGIDMFRSCRKSSKKVALPGSVTTIEYGAFANCKKADISLPGKVKRVGKYAFLNCKHLKKASLKKARTIGKGAFEGCKRLKSVTLGKSLKKVGAGAFSGTSKKLTFKAPKSKVKAYKKLLKKAGVKKPKVRAL